MKPTGGRLLAGIVIDRDADVPLYRQLYQQVRGLILDGTLSAGTRLPSTRTLIAELGVSRATVIAAFEQLSGEGFLEARRGDGTYIAPTWGTPVSPARTHRPPLAARGVVTSTRGAELFAHAPSTWTPHESGPFVASQIAVDAFPVRTWRRRSRITPPARTPTCSATATRTVTGPCARRLRSTSWTSGGWTAGPGRW